MSDDTPTRADLIERLRSVDVSWSEVGEWCAEAAAALTADAERIAELEGEVERLRIAEVAANQRAAQAEYRLYLFRQSRASTSKALAEFIKARAPDLWPDYAAISVNKSVYSDDYVQEPTWEREMNILRHRAEKAEDEATTLRAALKGTTHD